MHDEQSRQILKWPVSDWVAYLLIGGVAASLVSIFLSGLILFIGLIFWMLDCFDRGRIRLQAPPFKIPLYLFFFLACVSIVFSPDFWASVWYLKKFVKFLALFFIYTYLERKHIEKALPVIFLAAGASAVWAGVEYFWLKDVNLLNRIDGFMSHWMTFSGQVMIAAVALGGYLIHSWRGKGTSGSRRVLLTLLWPLLVSVTLLTLTRSAWIGMVGGLFVLLLTFKFRWALAGAGLAVLIFLLLPARFHERFYSSFDLTDTTTQGRLELLYTGSRMIRENPWTGVGPRLVYEHALNYRGQNEFLAYLYQHLHNNTLQIAAELGIPAALTWLAIWLWIVWDLLRFKRSRQDPFLAMLAAMALAVLAAFHLMGLFEYNFGDSEIAILVLFFVMIPFARDRELKEKAGEGKR